MRLGTSGRTCTGARAPVPTSHVHLRVAPVVCWLLRCNLRRPPISSAAVNAVPSGAAVGRPAPCPMWPNAMGVPVGIPCSRYWYSQRCTKGALQAVSNSSRPIFHIQIQPDRSSDLTLEAALSRLRSLSSLVRIVYGFDHGAYVDVDFFGNNSGLLWSAVRGILKCEPGFARSVIVACEGTRGWSNYRLLHHFDPTVRINEFR